MLKRIGLFLLTNVLVIAVLSISSTLISMFFGINVSWVFTGDYLWLFIFAAIIWFTWSFISLFMSKWSAKTMYGVQVITQADIIKLDEKEKAVYDLVERLARESRIDMPEVWIYQSPEPNAFATGATKNSSLVAVSSGLLDTMKIDEIEWVIAHEMAHIVNGDMVTMTLLQWVINTFVIFLSRILASIIDSFLRSDEEESSGTSWTYFVISFVLEIVFSILASIVVMWFSRHREYRADEGSARFVWKAKMIAALKKLQKLQNQMVTDDSDRLATMKIGSKGRSGLMAMFSSHPDLDLRIQNLEQSDIY